MGVYWGDRRPPAGACLLKAMSSLAEPLKIAFVDATACGFVARSFRHSPMKTLRIPLVLLLLPLLSSVLRAQSTALPYGAPIALEDAKRILVAAQAEAARNKWNVAIAIVDSGGHL